MADRTRYRPEPSSVETECDGIRPFLWLGNGDVVACVRQPGLHIAMDDNCECCDCTSHTGPGWTSLRWNRETPGAIAGVSAPTTGDANG